MTTFEKRQLGYQSNVLTKQDIYNSVINMEITSEDYKTITNEDIELPLEIVKQIKKVELWNACNTNILDGFYSNASGENLFYGFDLLDQQNISGIMSMIDIITFPINWKVKGFLQFVSLDKNQFCTLCLDGKAHKESNMQKYFTLCSQLDMAEDIATVNSIVW